MAPWFYCIGLIVLDLNVSSTYGFYRFYTSIQNEKQLEDKQCCFKTNDTRLNHKIILQSQTPHEGPGEPKCRVYSIYPEEFTRYLPICVDVLLPHSHISGRGSSALEKCGATGLVVTLFLTEREVQKHNFLKMWWLYVICQSTQTYKQFLFMTL